MSKWQQTQPQASNPLNIPAKNRMGIPEQDEEVVVGSIGSAEKMAWSKFLKQFNINGNEEETDIIGSAEGIDEAE